MTFLKILNSKCIIELIQIINITLIVIIISALSDTEKLLIVNKHNEIRASVNRGLHRNPTASYMMKLVSKLL